MSNNVVLAIDTDANGCICVADYSNKTVSWTNVPTIKQGKATFVDPVKLQEIILEMEATWKPSLCVIEQQAGRPGQHSARMFTFARNYGVFSAIIETNTAGKVLYVPASKWKFALKISKVKNENVTKALKVMGAEGFSVARKPKISCAEAFLMTYYGHKRGCK
jgi:hypothetical protein